MNSAEWATWQSGALEAGGEAGAVFSETDRTSDALCRTARAKSAGRRTYRFCQKLAAR